MGKTKPGARYQSVSLAIPFIEEIKKHIQNKPGYRSIADFVRAATREKMQYEDSKTEADFTRHAKQNQMSDGKIRDIVREELIKRLKGLP